MFAGGILSWLVIIPLMVFFGETLIVYPGMVTVGEIFSENGASGIWSNYIRYIGAGALAAGGIISLIKSTPLIVKTFIHAMKSMSGTGRSGNIRTSQDISMRAVLISIAVLTILVWIVPAIPVTFAGAVMVVIFGFFFATVSSRMVGIVGSSNNPVSGMSIATLLVATLLLKLTGSSGAQGMRSAVAIGSIICIVAAISGDTSQDLKTGFLLGATPKKQQISEIIGVVSAALAIGGTLYLLDYAWGFGSEELAAPQATLMKMIVEGVMEGNLPWTLVFIGACTAIVAEIIGIPSLPFAIGIYLPVHLNSCIMIGGVVRYVLEKSKKKRENDDIVSDGILFCSGMIAGEGLVGIFLALLAVLGVDKIIDISGVMRLSDGWTILFGIVTFSMIILSLLMFSVFKKRDKK